MRMARNSPPILKACEPLMRLRASATVIEYGSYGCERPFVELLERTRPPGMTMPEDDPWPAIPVLATEPLRLMTMFEKSMPLTTGFGSMPSIVVGTWL